jgi:MoxR-like ATPase
MFENRIDLTELNQAADRIRQEIGKVIVGQDNLINLMLTAILADGHILIEGVPGVAKTLAAKLMARSISVKFSRIQFTPDLMPSDVTGTNVFNMSTSQFSFNRGPIFSNLVLIDEINRAPAKTQSALFEVMEERQITSDGKTYPMEPPFIVIATQNPIEHEGTYRLPEAQLDRFLFKIEVDYPNLPEEEEILRRAQERKSAREMDHVSSVVGQQELIRYQAVVKEIRVDESVQKYIAQIVTKTRNNNSLYLGASPRASVNILNASKAFAAINGRDFVTPEDVQYVVYPVLQHRVILTPEKELEGKNTASVIRTIVQSVEVPR